MKKWLSRLAKITFFLAAFLAVILTALINMAGNSDTLKGAIEDYITQSTGYHARINDFKQMTFFPYISVDFEGLELKKMDHAALKIWAQGEMQKPPEQRETRPDIDFSIPDATIDRVLVSMQFWDIVLGSRDKIHNIYLDNANFRAYTLLAKPLHIGRLQIDETANAEPFLDVNGNVDGREFEINIDLQGFGSGNKRRYSLKQESALTASIADLSINAIIRPRNMGGFHLRDASITQAQNPILTTTTSISVERDKAMKFKGNFTMAEHGSQGEFDLIRDTAAPQGQGQITGIIDVQDAQKFEIADFNAGSRFAKIWRDWDDIFGKSVQDPVQDPAQDNEAPITITVKTPSGQIDLISQDNHFIIHDKE